MSALFSIKAMLHKAIMSQYEANFNVGQEKIVIFMKYATHYSKLKEQ